MIGRVGSCPAGVHGCRTDRGQPRVAISPRRRQSPRYFLPFLPFFLSLLSLAASAAAFLPGFFALPAGGASVSTVAVAGVRSADPFTVVAGAVLPAPFVAAAPR